MDVLPGIVPLAVPAAPVVPAGVPVAPAVPVVPVGVAVSGVAEVVPVAVELVLGIELPVALPTTAFDSVYPPPVAALELSAVSF